MKLVVAIILLCIVVLVHGGDKKYTSIDVCASNDTTAVEITKCDHTDHALIIVFTVKKVVRRMMVDFEISMKSDKNELRRVFKSPKTEWCSLVDGSAKNPNRFFKAFLDSMKETAPKLFIKCPLSGRYEFNNLTLSKKMLMIVPAGEYVFTINATDPVNRMKFVMRGQMVFEN